MRNRRMISMVDLMVVISILGVLVCLMIGLSGS